MRRIKDINEYDNIINKATRNKFKNVNCYLMPNEIREYTKDERLFYLENDNILEIIEIHDLFCKVCFYAKDNIEFLKFDLNRPILLDLPYNNIKNEKFEKIDKNLKEVGFSLNSQSSRMIKKDYIYKEYSSDIFKDFKIQKMENDELIDILKIWNENFNPLKNLLYSDNELLSHKNDIYVCIDKDNKIVGAMEIVINGKSGWIEKIAIKKDYQGRGIGTFMEIFYINLCKSLGIKNLLLYTIDDDYKAQNFHKKFGFEYDGKHNCQYIYSRS